MSTNLQPVKGYISKRLLKTVTAFLDLHGITTQIVKTKRVKQYIVYINFQVYGKPKRTRNAAKRIIWRVYKKLEAGHQVEQPPMGCQALGITKRQCIYPFCRCHSGASNIDTETGYPKEVVAKMMEEAKPKPDPDIASNVVHFGTAGSITE